MKLPIILSAMIAALTIPASIATEEKVETAAPEAEAAPTPEAEKTAPKAKGKKKHHAKGSHHLKKHAHHESATNSPTDPYKGEYNEKLRGADGDVNKDLSPKAGPQEVPGQKMP